MGLATNGRKCIADANDLHIKPVSLTSDNVPAHC